MLDWEGLAHAVNQRMAELEIEHEDLAEKAEISESNLWKIRSGESDTEFRRPTLKRLAEALDLPSDTFNREYRKPVPRNSALSDPSILAREVAKAIAPELARINERLERIETRLHLDLTHDSSDYVTPEINDSIHPREDPGQ